MPLLDFYANFSNIDSIQCSLTQYSVQKCNGLQMNALLDVLMQDSAILSHPLPIVLTVLSVSRSVDKHTLYLHRQIITHIHDPIIIPLKQVILLFLASWDMRISCAMQRMYGFDINSQHIAL